MGEPACPGPETEIDGSGLEHSRKSDDEAQAKRGERKEIDEQCLIRHRQGSTYAQVAQQLGVSLSRAHEGARRARDAEPKPFLDHQRLDMCAQLDALVGQMWAIIDDPQEATERKIRATAQTVNVIDRKARLLGADVPMQRVVEIGVFTEAALHDEQRRIERELAAAGYDLSQLPSVDEMADLLEDRMRGTGDGRSGRPSP